jgi:hypothetical protein
MTRRGSIVAVLLLASSSACASLPYERGSCAELDAMPLRESEAQIERGNPHGFLDGLGWVLGIPSKITLLSSKVDNHSISPETEAALTRYLEANGLCEVKVRINQYAVGREWSRLFRNRNIHPFWRYTFGILTMVDYTIFPQRAFGGDNYNPFTNTIHLYSDAEAIALHEAGHAKDFERREWKGAYAAVRILPLVPLLQEYRASDDALGYLRDAGQPAAEKRATPLLWGAYSTYIGGEALAFYAGPSYVGLVVIPLAWTGKLLGYLKSLSIDDAAPTPLEPVIYSPPPGVKEQT